MPLLLELNEKEGRRKKMKGGRREEEEENGQKNETNIYHI